MQLPNNGDSEDDSCIMVLKANNSLLSVSIFLESHLINVERTLLRLSWNQSLNDGRWWIILFLSHPYLHWFVTLSVFVGVFTHIYRHESKSRIWVAVVLQRLAPTHCWEDMVMFYERERTQLPRIFDRNVDIIYHFRKRLFESFSRVTTDRIRYSSTLSIKRWDVTLMCVVSIVLNLFPVGD